MNVTVFLSKICKDGTSWRPRNILSAMRLIDKALQNVPGPSALVAFCILMRPTETALPFIVLAVISFISIGLDIISLYFPYSPFDYLSRPMTMIIPALMFSALSN